MQWANCTSAAFDLLLTRECSLLPKPEWWHDGALKAISKTVVRVVDNGHGHMMRATVLSGQQPAWELSPRSAADLTEAAKHYSLAAKLVSAAQSYKRPPLALCLLRASPGPPTRRDGRTGAVLQRYLTHVPRASNISRKTLPPRLTTQARCPVQKLEFNDLAATHLRKAAAVEAAEAATEAAEAEAKAVARAEAEAKAHAAADALLAEEEALTERKAAAAKRAGKASSKGSKCKSKAVGKGKGSGTR